MRELCVLHTDLEHYPVNPEKSYFQERFREQDMRRIVGFLNGRRKPAEEGDENPAPMRGGESGSSAGERGSILRSF